MDGVLDTIGDASYIVMIIGANLFVVLYSALARFWRSESGWHIFSFMLMIALILDHSAVSLIFGAYPGRGWARAILYPLFALVLLWRVFILFKVQVMKRVSTSEYEIDKPR